MDASRAEAALDGARVGSEGTGRNGQAESEQTVRVAPSHLCTKLRQRFSAVI